MDAEGGYEQARFWTFLLVPPAPSKGASRSPKFVIVREGLLMSCQRSTKL